MVKVSLDGTPNKGWVVLLISPPQLVIGNSILMTASGFIVNLIWLYKLLIEHFTSNRTCYDDGGGGGVGGDDDDDDCQYDNDCEVHSDTDASGGYVADHYSGNDARISDYCDKNHG